MMYNLPGEILRLIFEYANYNCNRHKICLHCGEEFLIKSNDTCPFGICYM